MQNNFNQFPKNLQIISFAFNNTNVCRVCTLCQATVPKQTQIVAFQGGLAGPGEGQGLDSFVFLFIL